MKIRVEAGSGTLRDPSAKAFHTFSSYIQAWAELIGTPGGLVDQGPARAVSAPTCERIEESLFRGWSNLRALRILGDDGLPSEILPLHPPVAWYAIHHVAQGGLLAKNGTSAASHGALLTMLAKESEHGHLPDPWSAYGEGDPADRRFGGSAVGWAYSHSNLSSFDSAPAEAWAAMSLKTTRVADFDKRLAAWRKAKGRTRVPAGERAKMAGMLRPTTVFDVLYRFRDESQYGSTEHFRGDRLGHDPERFARALYLVTDETTLMLEQGLIDCVGGQVYEGIRDRYASRHRIDPKLSQFLQRRELAPF